MHQFMLGFFTLQRRSNSLRPKTTPRKDTTLPSQNSQPTIPKSQHTQPKFPPNIPRWCYPAPRWYGSLRQLCCGTTPQLCDGTSSLQYCGCTAPAQRCCCNLAAATSAAPKLTPLTPNLIAPNLNHGRQSLLCRICCCNVCPHPVYFSSFSSPSLHILSHTPSSVLLHHLHSSSPIPS